MGEERNVQDPELVTGHVHLTNLQQEFFVTKQRCGVHRSYLLYSVEPVLHKPSIEHWHVAMCDVEWLPTLVPISGECHFQQVCL